VVATRAYRTLKNWKHLFTFISHEGVEPTNNAAERALRFAVQWRKICFGSHPQPGNDSRNAPLPLPGPAGFKEETPSISS